MRWGRWRRRCRSAGSSPAFGIANLVWAGGQLAGAAGGGALAGAAGDAAAFAAIGALAGATLLGLLVAVDPRVS